MTFQTAEPTSPPISSDQPSQLPLPHCVQVALPIGRLRHKIGLGTRPEQLYRQGCDSVHFIAFGRCNQLQAEMGVGMALFGKNFDDISEGNLSDLVAGAAPESLVLEYKQAGYTTDHDGRREFLKDVSALANSSGGHIVIGMTEADGGAGGLMAVDAPDEQITRMENTARDGLQPRVQGIRMKAISLMGGGAAIVISVPRSWNAPHRVSAQNSNRFYVRNSNGVHEAGVDELRRLFNGGMEFEQAARSFRAERVALIAANEGPRAIEGNGRLIVHVLPLFSGQSDPLNIETLYKAHGSFRPLAADYGHTPQLTIDGFMNFRGGDKCYGYTQVFRNGTVEATLADIIADWRGTSIIKPAVLVDYTMEALGTYLPGLRDIGVAPPLAIMISLQGMEGVRQAMPGGENEVRDSQPFRYSEVLLPHILLPDYGSDADRQKAIRPAFDTLWNAASYVKCMSFDENDRWMPTRSR